MNSLNVDQTSEDIHFFNELQGIYIVVIRYKSGMRDCVSR